MTDLQDGLVHIRSIAAGRVEKVSDYLDVGDKVWAKASFEAPPLATCFGPGTLRRACQTGRVSCS